MKKARSDSFWKCQGCSFCSQQDCFWLSLVLLPTLEKGCFQAKCPPYVCLYVQNVHPALEYAYKLCWKLHSWDFHAIFDFCISKKGAATPFPTYPLYSVGWELSWEHMQRWLTPRFHWHALFPVDLSCWFARWCNMQNIRAVHPTFCLPRPLSCIPCILI